MPNYRYDPLSDKIIDYDQVMERQATEKAKKMSDQAARMKAQEVFGPDVKITSGHRDANHPLSKKNPHSSHLGYDTIDLAWDGKSRHEDYIDKLRAKGLQEGRDYKMLYEVGHGKSPWATGDHVHIQWLKPADGSLMRAKQQETQLAQKQAEQQQKEQAKQLELQQKEQQKMQAQQIAEAQKAAKFELPQLHKIADIVTDYTYGRQQQPEQKGESPEIAQMREEHQMQLERQRRLAELEKQQQEEEKQRLYDEEHSKFISELVSRSGKSLQELAQPQQQSQPEFDWKSFV